MTTPADPGVIDLDDARRHVSSLLDEAHGDRHSSSYFAAARIHTLIAAVEALEDEVEQAIKWQQFYMTKAEATETRVAKLNGEIETLRKAAKDATRNETPV